MSESKVLQGWRKASGTAIGRWLFSRAVCLKAPYFATIRPTLDVLEPGRAVARMKKRRAVTNHIGTIHAIAMANLCEFVAGTMTEISIPRSMRWIPKGMQIAYRGKAETGLEAEATLAPVREGEKQDATVSVDVRDDAGNIVVHADITMYVSPRSVG